MKKIMLGDGVKYGKIKSIFNNRVIKIKSDSSYLFFSNGQIEIKIFNFTFIIVSKMLMNYMEISVL